MRIYELFDDLPSILEMSMLIEPMDDHALNTPEGNLMAFKLYISHDNDIEPLTDNINIYRGYGRKRDWIFAADPDKQEIYYLMQYVEGRDKQLKHYCMQKWLWVNPHMRSVVGQLPTKYFFKLLDEFGTIVTDSEQTPDGKKFWIRRIKESFAKGFNVYYYNFNDGQLLKLSGADDVDVFDQKHQIYTQQEHSLDKAFVISKNNL
jgi:hypothetical protein